MCLLFLGRMWIRPISHRAFRIHVLLRHRILIFKLLNTLSRGPFYTLYLSAASALMAISFEHLLLLSGHIAFVELLEDVVLYIRILLHDSELRTCLIEIVSWDASRTLGFDVHLTWFLGDERLLCFLLKAWTNSFLFSAAWSGFFLLRLFGRVICVLSNCVTPRVANRLLVSIAEDLGIVLILVELSLVLTSILGNLIILRGWSSLVEIIDRWASGLRFTHHLLSLESTHVLMLLLLKIAGRLWSWLCLWLDVSTLRPSVGHVLCWIFLGSISIYCLLLIVDDIITILDDIAIFVSGMVGILWLGPLLYHSALITGRGPYLLRRLSSWSYLLFILGRTSCQSKVILVRV